MVSRGVVHHYSSVRGARLSALQNTSQCQCDGSHPLESTMSLVSSRVHSSNLVQPRGVSRVWYWNQPRLRVMHILYTPCSNIRVRPLQWRFAALPITNAHTFVHSLIGQNFLAASLTLDEPYAEGKRWTCLHAER